jgi:hypothetical protein
MSGYYQLRDREGASDHRLVSLLETGKVYFEEICCVRGFGFESVFRKELGHMRVVSLGRTAVGEIAPWKTPEVAVELRRYVKEFMDDGDELLILGQVKEAGE